VPKQLMILVPDRVFDALDRIEKTHGYKKEDLIIRAIVKVIEEFGGV